MAAATQTLPVLLTLQEYLHTTYHPDCDFVDDHIEERNMGESEHSDIQTELLFWFRAHKTEWNIRVNGELRTQVSKTRFRVPDVCVRLLSAPREKIVVTPPLIAIEVLSPEDRMDRTVRRLKDFLTMGVPNVWLIDPQDRVAYAFTEGGLNLVETQRITVANSPIYLDLPQIFAALD